MSGPKSLLAADGDLLTLGRPIHLLMGFAGQLLLGFVLGALAARAMRAGRLHWGWTVVVALLALPLRPVSHSLASTSLCAVLFTLLRGRRWHREDLEAGADLARAAALRRTPLVALWSLLRRLLSKNRNGRLGVRCWSRGGELILGHTSTGKSVSIPFGGARGGTHTLLVGATGSGKTVTQAWLATRGIERGMGAVVIDPKGDRAMREAVADAARRAGKQLIVWTAEGPSVYNPFARGTDTEIADKVLAGERFTEPHYLRQAQRFLGHVVRGLRASGGEVSLRAIVSSLDPEALEVLARGLPESTARPVHAYLDSLTTRQLSDLAGARDRLAILAESDLGPWLDPENGRGGRFDLQEAIRARAVVYFDLDADRRPLLMQMLGAAIVQDLLTTVAELQGDPTPTVVVIDEFSAVAAENVVRLFGRARSAGLSLVLSTQELTDLRLPGREHLLEQVLGNLTVLLAHRQVVPASAELISSLTGTRGTWRTTQQDRGRSSRTRVRENVLGSSELMQLPPGWLAAVTLGNATGVQIAQVFPPREEVQR